MRKYILSAMAGALGMLLTLTVIANSSARKQAVEEYKHVDYISAITPEDCFVCADPANAPVRSYWGDDNVGIVNLNTFDFLYLEIRRRGGEGKLSDAAGHLTSTGLIDQEAESYVHAFVHQDNFYADVQITGVRYAIDRNSVQNRLCQTCLDAINGLWFTDQPPAEYAIVSFEDRTLRPLLNSHPWFSAGNYGIDCEFKDDGAIDLLIHYLKSTDS